MGQEQTYNIVNVQFSLTKNFSDDNLSRTVREVQKSQRRQNALQNNMLINSKMQLESSNIKQRVEKNEKKLFKECQDYRIALDMTNIEFYEKARVDQFNDHYQYRKTKIEIFTQQKLCKNYNQTTNHLKKELRSLNWQKTRCLSSRNRINEFINQNCSSMKSTNIWKQDRKIKNYTQSTVPDLNSVDIVQKCLKTFKSTCNLSQKCLSCILEGTNRRHNLHNSELRSASNDKMKTIQEELKKLRLQAEYQRFRKSVITEPEMGDDKKDKTVFIENNMYSDLDNHVKVFQRLIRGRAYHAMMFMARHKLDEMLKTVLGLEAPSQPVKTKENNKQEIIHDGQISLTNKLISYFLVTTSKETLRMQEEEKHKMLMKHAERVKAMTEATEGRRRQKEGKIRMENDEMFKQVMKIHQETAELTYDEFIERAIERSAEEQSTRYMKKLASKTYPHKDDFYDPNRKELETELVFNFVVPESCKAIMRKNIKAKQIKYLEIARNIVFEESANTEEYIIY